ncbi:hypothetical protein EV421DRAFT_1411445 [Armillaria borealis]|uniref:Uncharacterized protein n=1 Tax=Armillaria borealis TaxID=47425 RepID=A0AA39JUW5_9AGAR|nr:hypothetical protein EV421DRAFT_1411445 [Armillaria borealis]
MPFSTDTNWPQGLSKIFSICRQQNQPFEYRYYGPYDKLLNYCFETDSFQFFVTPQHPPSELSASDAVSFIVFIVVFNEQRQPVLLAEIKDDGWAGKPDFHLAADKLVRRRYDSMMPECPLPRLWGLSLLSTSLRVYRGDIATGSLQPEYQAHPDLNRILPLNFLEGEWDLDILSQEGFNKMKGIVTDILTASAHM